MPMNELKNSSATDSDSTGQAGADPGRALCRRCLSLSQQGDLSHLVQGGVKVAVCETRKAEIEFEWNVVQ